MIVQPSLGSVRKKISIGGVEYEIDDAVNMFAFGGQAKIYWLVVAGVLKAVKIYNTTRRNTLEKIGHMIKARSKLPQEQMIWPEQFVADEEGNIIGFTMPALPEGFYTLAKIANDSTVRSKVKLSQVIRALIKLHSLIRWMHSLGIVGADTITPNNICFDELGRTFLIDLDSLQISTYLCGAYTLAYVPPEFDVANIKHQAVFTPLTDWYAFAAVVFEMIFGWPPFGGPHPKYPDEAYQERALAGAWIFDPDIPPGTVYDQALASTSLLKVFQRMFLDNERFVFPLDVLEEYLTMLTPCIDCGKDAPNDLSHCPYCGKPHEDEQGDVMNPPPKRILELGSQILYAGGYQRDELIVLASQGDETWIHLLKPDQQAKHKLFDFILPAHSQVELCGKFLVIGQPDINDLFVLDPVSHIGVGTILGCSRSADNFHLWTTNASRIFFTRRNEAGEEILHVAVFHQLGIAEKPLVSIGKGVAQIAAMSEGPDTSILVIYDNGATQIYRANGKPMARRRLAERQAHQHLVRTLVDRSAANMLVRRVFHGGDEPVIMTDIIGHNGKLIFSKKQPLASYPSAMSLQTGMYGSEVLLHATTKGVVKENVQSGKITLLQPTAGLLKPASMLCWHNDGLIAVYPQAIDYIKLRN